MTVEMNSSGVHPAPALAHLDDAQLMAEQLRELLAELSDLGSREEKQFLFIGARLLDFRQRSRKIASLTDEAVDLVAGQQGKTTLQGLSVLFDEFDTHLHKIDRQSLDNDRLLETLGQLLGRMDSPLRALSKVVKTLLALGFATRVEGAHGASGAVLINLADNLKGLGGMVAEKTERVAAMVETMNVLSQEARSRLQALQGKGIGQARQVIGAGRNAVGRLAQRQQQCIEGTTRLKSHFTEITRAVDEVVVSIQFHDITRQQMDHVRGALQDLATELERRKHGSSGVAAPIASFVPGVCQVQVAQLYHTRDELMGAVNRMIASLNTLDSNITELAVETRELGGAGGDGASFYAEIDPVVSAVASILVDSTTTNRQALTAVSSVLGAVDELSRLLGEIEQIGTEMKLIAFNAGITAAHNMEQGAGLRVIAEAIQTLSEEVRARTVEFSRGYHEIAAVVGALGEADGLHDRCELVVRDDLQQLAGTQLATLRECDSRLLALLRIIDESATGLAGDLRATSGSISVHVDVGQVIEETINGLESLVAWSWNRSGGAPVADSTDVVHLSDRYTMQSEREVHRQFGGRAAKRVRPEGRQPSEVPATGSEFGDNVELF